MGTYCAPSVADLFLFCYERDFISACLDLNLSVNKLIIQFLKKYMINGMVLILILLISRSSMVMSLCVQNYLNLFAL